MTTADDGEPRTLRLGLSLLCSGQAWLLISGLLAIPVFLLVVLVLVLRETRDSGQGTWELLREVWMKFLQEPGSEAVLWATIIVLPFALVLLAGHRAASLRVSSLGLQARIPRWLGVGPFGQTAGRWEVLWEAVRRVSLERPAGKLKSVQRLGWYRLVVETGEEEIRINPFAWFDPAGTDHRLRLGELLRPRSFDVEQRVSDAPLVQAFETRGFQLETVESGWKIAGARFDLTRHPGMLALLAAFFAAGSYALVDTYITGSYRALEPLPVMPFFEAAAVAGLAAWLLGRGAPALERVVVGLLAVAAVVAAVHPALLRLNAATAEPESVRYRAAAPGMFEASDGRYPAIDLTDLQAEEYWAAHPSGSLHEFTLLHGKAGFYQLDLSPLYARTRAFYESRSTD